MKVAAISVGMLIALLCAFLLGGYFLGGKLGNGASVSISLHEPAPAESAPAEPARDDPVTPAEPPQRPKFPHMELQAQYAGPFEDTLIQRWRDPIDNRVCYIYLPMNVKHAPERQGGVLDYGANTLGSISCGAPGPDVVRRKTRDVPVPMAK